MRESAITTGTTIDALRAHDMAPSWARAYLTSRAHSWQRSEAVAGLIGAAHLQFGSRAYISIDEGRARRDARLVINGMPYSIAAIAA